MTGINWFALGCRLEEEEENEEEGPEVEVNHAHAEHQNGGTPPDVWVPVALGLGLPLSPDKLCIAVCGRAGASNFLEVCFAGCPPSQWVNNVGRYPRKERQQQNAQEEQETGQNVLLCLTTVQKDRSFVRAPVKSIAVHWCWMVKMYCDVHR